MIALLFGLLWHITKITFLSIFLRKLQIPMHLREIIQKDPVYILSSSPQVVQYTTTVYYHNLNINIVHHTNIIQLFPVLYSGVLVYLYVCTFVYLVPYRFVTGTFLYGSPIQDTEQFDHRKNPCCYPFITTLQPSCPKPFPCP